VQFIIRVCVFVQGGCYIYLFIYFHYVSAFIPFALISCLHGRHEAKGHGQQYPHLPCLHTQTHTHSTSHFLHGHSVLWTSTNLAKSRQGDLERSKDELNTVLYRS
jgi:hypothetical protein